MSVKQFYWLLQAYAAILCLTKPSLGVYYELQFSANQYNTSVWCILEISHVLLQCMVLSWWYGWFSARLQYLQCSSIRFFCRFMWSIYPHCSAFFRGRWAIIWGQGASKVTVKCLGEINLYQIIKKNPLKSMNHVDCSWEKTYYKSMV